MFAVDLVKDVPTSYTQRRSQSHRGVKIFHHWKIVSTRVRHDLPPADHTDAGFKTGD